MIPKWMEEKSIKEKANKKEKKFAKEIGARQTTNSGTCWSNKADIKIENTLVEIKTTDKKSLKVQEEFLAKIFAEALNVSKEPFLVVEFKGYRLVGRVEKR